ncbi:MAG: outer membrane lipoprotein-sorting protein [Acidobacteriota bacterium]|jgi:hypothetical protein
MRFTHVLTVTLVLSTLCCVPAVFARSGPAESRTGNGAEGGSPDGEARRIVERSKERTDSRTEHVVYRMELVDGEGEVEQTRRLESYFLQDDPGTTTLLKFQAPPVVEGTGMLVETHEGAPSDIWVYLPVTRRLRRIAGSDKDDKFLGTEFTYEDFEGYRPDAYEFELRGTEPCLDDARCRVVEARPATDGERRASGYAEKVYWIERESLYPVRIDLYEEGSGELVKRLTVAGLERQGEYWRAAEQTMHDLRTGRRTRLTALEREIDTDLDPYHVSRRYLRSE